MPFEKIDLKEKLKTKNNNKKIVQLQTQGVGEYPI